MNEMKKLAELCIKYVGSSENISSVSHCATRLRLTLIDQSKVDEKALVAVKGVMKVMQVGTQTQIVVGTDAPELYNVVSKMVDSEKAEGSVPDDEHTEQDKKSKWSVKAMVGRFFDACSSIFTTLVPAFTAAGLLKAVLAILVATGLVTKTTPEYVIIDYVSETVFYFLPILLGVTTATYFNCDKFIAAAICAMFVHPTYTGLVSAGEAVTFFGIPLVLYNYASTAFPAILTVWFMSYVEKFANKVSPMAVKAVMKPILTLIITFPLGLFVLGPIGAVLGDVVMGGVKILEGTVPWLVPTIIGAFTPFLVFVGMHRAISTFETMQIAQMGYSAINGVGQLPSNIAQGAATIVLAIKSKDEKYKPLAFSAGITALCGITEPALYGFTAKNKKALISTVIGGGLGGFYAGITHVVRFAKGGPGIPTLPIFIDLNNPMNLINAIVAAIIGFVVSFAIAMIWIKPEEIR